MKRKSKVVLDVPLLFEKDDLKKYDLKILVTCSEKIQKLRVLRRKDWDQKRFNDVIKFQFKDSVKKKLSDVIIKTDRNKRNTYNSVRKIINICNHMKVRKINEVLGKF